jgi:hypothetical protein
VSEQGEDRTNERITDLAERLNYLTRQVRMLFVQLGTDARFRGMICVNTACGFSDGGMVPHMTEEPGLCPQLRTGRTGD